MNKYHRTIETRWVKAYADSNPSFNMAELGFSSEDNCRITQALLKNINKRFHDRNIS